MQERWVMSHPAESVPFQSLHDGVQTEQSQYQQDVFQTLLKWVAGVCSLLALAYRVTFIQQEVWTALVQRVIS